MIAVLIVTGFSFAHSPSPPDSSRLTTAAIGPPDVNTTAVSPFPSRSAVRRTAASDRSQKAWKDSV